jgi:hypothetical protein
MKVEKATDRIEMPKECDNCGSLRVKLTRYYFFGPGHQVEWLCKYCAVAINKERDFNRNMASMFNLLEDRLVGIKNA